MIVKRPHSLSAKPLAPISQGFGHFKTIVFNMDGCTNGEEHAQEVASTSTTVGRPQGRQNDAKINSGTPRPLLCESQCEVLWDLSDH